MGILSTIKNVAQIGGALGGLFNFGSSGGTDIGASKALMSHQMDLQKDYTQWLNENQYSQLRTGLENAGYNPLLALGSSPQQGQIGMGSAVSGSTASFNPGELLNAVATVAQIKNTDADTQNKQLGTIVSQIKNWINLLGQSSGNTANSNLSDKIIYKLKSAALNVANNIYKDSKSSSTPMLKGYISNTASDFGANERFREVPELNNIPLPKELRNLQGLT